MTSNQYGLRSPMGLAAFLFQRILPLAALPFSAFGVYRVQFRIAACTMRQRRMFQQSRVARHRGAGFQPAMPAFTRAFFGDRAARVSERSVGGSKSSRCTKKQASRSTSSAKFRGIGRSETSVIRPSLERYKKPAKGLAKACKMITCDEESEMEIPDKPKADLP